VTAPTSRSTVSTTGMHTRLYVAIRRVISDSAVVGSSGSMSLSTTPPSSADGISRSSRWKCTTPRYRPVGVAIGARATNTPAATAGDSWGSRMRASASATVESGVMMIGSEVIRLPAVPGW
jgi:hypothetical protein